MKKDPIDVIAYDPRWAEEGLAHTEAVAGALGPLALRVDHIGSTAVPGLAAKDVIDVQALVSRLEDDGIAAAMAFARHERHLRRLAQVMQCRRLALPVKLG